MYIGTTAAALFCRVSQALVECFRLKYFTMAYGFVMNSLSQQNLPTQIAKEIAALKLDVVNVAM